MRPQCSTGLLCRIAIAAMIILACLPALGEQAAQELIGTLSYPDGSPASGLTMVFQTLDPATNRWENVEAVTDGAGGYHAALRSGNSWVKARQGDYILYDFVTLSSSTGQPSRKDFVLSYACVLFGEVTDASTGAPITGAQVAVYGQYYAKTSSGADGMFKLRVPPKPAMDLHVSMDGYVTRRMTFSAETLETTAFRIALKPGGVIHGRVTDENGEPIAGAEVDVTEDLVYANSTTTGADGFYELRNVDPDKPAEVRFSNPGHGQSRTYTARFSGSRDVRLDAVLPRETLRTITGRVTDAGGVPMAGASVVFGTSRSDAGGDRTSTDANGEYRLDKISVGQSMILVQATGYSPAFLPVNADGNQRIDAVLEKGHFAGGRVVDASGSPIRDVSISVGARTPVLGRLWSSAIVDADVYNWLATRVPTDENGVFGLGDLPATGVVLSVYAPGYAAPRYVGIRVDTADNVIVMRRTAVTTGKVADADTGKPIQGFTVRWGSRYRESTAFNTPDGTFKLELGDSSQADIKVTARGHISEARTTKTTEGPGIDLSNVFSLHKAIRVNGRVIDEAGKGIDGVKVSIVETGGIDPYMVPPRLNENAYQVTANTGSDGGFTVSDVQERTADIILEKSGFPTVVRRDIDLTKPVQVTLSAPAELEIRAKSFAGEKSDVNLVYTKDHCSTSLPAKDLPEDGHAVYSDLQPGRYVVIVSGNGRGSYRVVNLDSGAKKAIDLDSNSVVIKGIVTRREAPVSGLRVIIDRQSELTGISNEYSDSCMTDAQGRFEITTDKPGPVIVECYEAGSVPICRPMKLKEGENTIDLHLPTGAVTGRVVDAQGRPMAGEIIQAQARWDGPAARRYDRPVETGVWGRPMSTARTADDGSFTLEGVSGEVVIAVVTDQPLQKYVGSPMKVADGQAVSGLAVQIPEPGKVDLSVVDAVSGQPRQPCYVAAVTLDGVPVYSRSNFTSASVLPAGKYTMWAHPDDDAYLPAYADIEVKSGKTAKVRMEVQPARQRIVFRIAKAGKPAGLISSPTGELEWAGQKAWIGYSLSDAVTGKPALASSVGPRSGGCLAVFDQDELAVPVKPGKYLLEAVLRNTNDFFADSKANLWYIRREVVVNEGRDSVIDVQ